MPYYSVKTYANSEVQTAEMICEKGGDEILAALVPDGLTSYIMIEAEGPEYIEQVLPEVPPAQKVVEGEAKSEQVLEFLDPPGDVDHISQGDIVEITSGPFSGEKARITKLQENSGKVTVEMMESTVPIPVEMNGTEVRRLDSDERK